MVTSLTVTECWVNRFLSIIRPVLPVDVGGAYLIKLPLISIGVDLLCDLSSSPVLVVLLIECSLWFGDETVRSGEVEEEENIVVAGETDNERSPILSDLEECESLSVASDSSESDPDASFLVPLEIRDFLLAFWDDFLFFGLDSASSKSESRSSISSPSSSSSGDISLGPPGRLGLFVFELPSDEVVGAWLLLMPDVEVRPLLGIAGFARVCCLICSCCFTTWATIVSALHRGFLVEVPRLRSQISHLNLSAEFL